MDSNISNALLAGLLERFGDDWTAKQLTNIATAAREQDYFTEDTPNDEAVKAVVAYYMDSGDEG